MLQAALLALAPVLILPAPVSGSSGPPAICFPLEIGEARSLPWGGASPFEPDPSYPQDRLVTDVVSLLEESDDGLVHAETLRRAVLYLTQAGERGGVQARVRQLELVSALQARALGAELAAAQGSIDAQVRALAWLDVGYLLGAFDQMGLEPVAAPLPALQRASALAPEDGGVALAAWLASWSRGAAENERDRLLAAAVKLADDPEGLVRTNLMRVAVPLLGIETYDQLAARADGADTRGG